MMDRVVLGLLVAFLALTVIEAFKCYSCTTLKEGSICSDDFFDESKVSTEECPARRVCSKIKVSNSTTRGCAKIFSKQGCNTTSEGRLECICKADRCNGVNVTFYNPTPEKDSMPTIAIVVAVIAIVLLIVIAITVYIIIRWKRAQRVSRRQNDTPAGDVTVEPLNSQDEVQDDCRNR